MLKLSAVSAGLILLDSCSCVFVHSFSSEMYHKELFEVFFFLKVFQCIYSKRIQMSNFLSHKAMDPEE